ACTTDVDCPGGACGAVVVYTSPTSLGNYLGIYRALDNSGEAVELDGNPFLTVVDFQVNGNIVAFRVAEDYLFDLNNDPDKTDVVMFAYSLKSRRVFSTAMASRECSVAGCEPGLPYKIRDGAIYFTTDEHDQGCSTDPNDKAHFS